jgi:putative ABC transport system permease protein
MSSFNGFGAWLRAVLWRRRVEAELDEELRDHFAREFERQADDRVRPAEAARRAAIRAGNLEAAKENVRDVRGGRLLSDLASDIRIGWRGLRRNRGFAAAVIVSLGLGVGGVTAISSVVHAVVLRSLPYANAERLHLLRVWWGSFSAALSPADFDILRERSAPVGRVAAYFFPDDGFTMVTPTGPEVVEGAFITAELPAVLGVPMVIGPGFSPNPDAFEVLIGHDLWQRRFGGRADAIGRTLSLDGREEAIVGVMPAGFGVPGSGGPGGEEVWVKGRWRQPTRRGPFYLHTVIRLRDGLAPAAAATQLTGLVAPVLSARVGGNPNWGYGVRSVLDTIVGDSRRTLTLALVAVALVLLISILNVANLLLARGTVRMREFAVRASLGAGRGRLARQALTEAALLGVCGGALGLGIGAAAVSMFRDAALTIVPRMHEVEMDVSLAMFALAIGIASGLIAGAIPLLRSRWNGLANSLRDDGRTIGGGHTVMRRTLVALEIAVTLTVLTGAALLAKTLHRLDSADPGFVAENRLSFRLVLPRVRYSESRLPAFLDDLGRRLRALPGVTGVTMSGALPPNKLSGSNNYTVEGQTNERGAGVAEVVEADAAFLDTLGIRLVRGRAFTDADRPQSPLVAIVNESFARRQFGSVDPIGKRFKSGDPKSTAPWLTIVGIVGDVPYGRGVWGGADQTVYVPYAQNLSSRSPYVVVAAANAPALVDSIRELVHALDPSLPVRDIATMEERLRRAALVPRFRSWLASALAGIALLLAATGIYGVMSYHVNQRRRETAIRRALGAREGQIVASVLASGLRLAAAGLVIGAAGAIAASRSLGSVLFRVDPRDPTVLAAAILALAVAALLACLIPAARAARIDPAVILREQ